MGHVSPNGRIEGGLTGQDGHDALRLLKLGTIA